MSMLRWFGHVDRMSESRQSSDVTGNAGKDIHWPYWSFRKVRYLILATGVRV